VPVPSKYGSPSSLLELPNPEDEMTAILPKVDYPTTHSNIKKELNLHANP